MRRSKYTCLLSILLIAACLVSACDREKALTFSVTFDEADNLQPGQFLTYNGIRIGEVTAVELEPTNKVRVDVQVDPEHKDRVYREARFAIAKPNGLLDLSGERCLEMKDNNGTRTTIQDGEVIEGHDGWLDGVISGAGGLLKTVEEKIITAHRDSPEAQAFTKTLTDFVEEAGAVASVRFREWADENLPAVEEKARAYRDKLEREGKTEEAEIFWKWFTEWSKAINSSESLPDPPINEPER